MAVRSCDSNGDRCPPIPAPRKMSKSSDSGIVNEISEKPPPLQPRNTKYKFAQNQLFFCSPPPACPTRKGDGVPYMCSDHNTSISSPKAKCMEETGNYIPPDPESPVFPEPGHPSVYLSMDQWKCSNKSPECRTPSKKDIKSSISDDSSISKDSLYCSWMTEERPSEILNDSLSSDETLNDSSSSPELPQEPIPIPFKPDLENYRESYIPDTRLSRLYEDEPLYQIYFQETIARGVMVQSNGSDYDDCDIYADYGFIQSCITNALMKTSEKRGQSMSDVDAEKKSRLTLGNFVQTCGKKRFWIDTPQVKSSGVAESMTKNQKRLQECLFEIITSEASYYKSLSLLQTHFMASPKLNPSSNSSIIDKTTFHYLFSNICDVADASQKMLDVLNSEWQKSFMLDPCSICREMEAVANEHAHCHVIYLTNIQYQQKTLTELWHNLLFKAAMEDLEAAPEVQGLKFQSFIMAPFQRVTRMPLLIETFCHFLDDEGNYDEGLLPEDISSCLYSFQKIAKDCNEGARVMENLELMNEINSKLKFKNGMKKIPIVSQKRNLMKKGPLMQVKHQTSSSSTLQKLKSWFPISKMKDTVLLDLFVFNDLLLMTKKDGEQYHVFAHSSKSQFCSETIEDNNAIKFVQGTVPVGCRYLFCLGLSNMNLQFIFSCDSESERARWIEVLNPAKEADEENEKIYDMDDCPQVYAISSFEATQADELNLDRGDIINVLRKMADGWYEGERTRDGRRGWFHSNCTVEIENAHMRKRNLVQQWRLLKQS